MRINKVISTEECITELETPHGSSLTWEKPSFTDMSEKCSHDCTCHGPKYAEGGKLKGRKALITGANSSIGRAVALTYAREGADVAIHCSPGEYDQVQELLMLIRAEGRTAIAIAGDICQESFCVSLVRNAAKSLGGLDILVNNAGRQQHNESIFTLDTKDFDATFKTNIYALFWITKAALRFIPPGGSIINTSSAQAFRPSESLLDYSQTKAAVIAFTKSLAQQLAPLRIKVNAVALGTHRKALRATERGSPDNTYTSSFSTSYDRPSHLQEMESLYVTLASREGSFITGHVWCTEGRPGPF